MSVAEPAGAVRERIAPWGDRLSVAAVNGPAATVVSGEPAALDELAAACGTAGVRTRVLPVDYASHGPQVAQIREQLLADLAAVTPGPAVIPMVSAMTGQWLDGLEAEAAYWYESLRSPVEFGRAVQVLAEAGHRTFVEVSPHPVLVPAITAPAVTGTLRRDDGGPGRFLAALADVHVQGVPVDWAAVLPAGRPADLPTYAFQHQRFWPEPAPPAAGDARSLGLHAMGHPLLGAAVELAGGDGYLLTGRVSVRSQPWLADHAVGGTVLLPGTAFAELAIAAGDAGGCGRIEELALEAPLALAPDGAVQLQVTVGGPDERGHRAVRVYARAEEAEAGEPWQRHASGRLGPAMAPAAGLAAGFAVWPPEGAEPLAVDGLYDGLAAGGYGYGPAFRGLRAAWRRGEDIFAEVVLPPETMREADSFGLHPALLDAALHAAGLSAAAAAPDAAAPGAGQVRLPFAWTGVALHTAGAGALRVRLRPAAGGTVSLEAADGAGRPVVTVGSLVLRPVAVHELARPAGDGRLRQALFTAEWVPVPVPETQAPVPELVRAGAGPGGGARAARAEAVRLLGIVQEWLAGDRPAGDRLAVVTRGAVSVAAGEGVADLAGAAVWGLIRSVQSENPDRLVLADLPADEAETAAALSLLARALASGEPELALRSQTAYARRLVHPADGLVPPGGGRPWRLETTGTGTLDGLTLARPGRCGSRSARPG
jgi:acyl transferase domain-containing protein